VKVSVPLTELVSPVQRELSTVGMKLARKGSSVTAVARAADGVAAADRNSVRAIRNLSAAPRLPRMRNFAWEILECSSRGL
jgi:hypothetical protein